MLQPTNGTSGLSFFPSQLRKWFGVRRAENKRVVAAFVPRLNSCSDEGKRGDRIVRTAAALGLPIITFGLLGRTNLATSKISLEPFSSNVHVPLGQKQIEVGLCGGWVGKESHEDSGAAARETDMSLIEGGNPVILLGSPATVLGEPMPLGVEGKPWEKKGEEPWALDGASLLQQAMILGLGPIQMLNNFGLLREISHYYLGDPLAALSMFEWIRHDPKSNIDGVTGEITDKGLLNLRKKFSASVGEHALSAVPREAVSLSLARDLFRDPLLLKAFSYYGRDERRVTFDTLVSQLLGISSLATISLSRGNAVALDGEDTSLRRAYELCWREDWPNFAGVGNRSSVNKVEGLLVQAATAAVSLAGASSLVEIDRVVAESLLKALGAVRVNYYEVKREEEVRIRNQWKLDANGGLIERERSELSDSGFINWVKLEAFRSEIMGKVFARKDEEGQGWQEIFDPTSRDDCARGTKAAPNYPFALFPVVINEKLVGVIKLDFTDVRSFAVTGDQRVFIKTLVNQASAQKLKFL